MSWNPFDAPVNKFLLVNYWSPGICRGPTGAGVGRKLDERGGYGLDYAFLIFTGRELAEWQMDLLLVTRKDWEDWQQFRKLIHAVPSRGPVNTTTNGYKPGKSMLIWHPQLAPLGITQCVVKHEPQEEYQQGNYYTVPLKFKQVVSAPKQAYAKPEAAADKPPADPQEQIIADKIARNKLASQQQADAAMGGT